MINNEKYNDSHIAAKPATYASLPQIMSNPADRYKPFPLTDIQQAYWVGRHHGFELGGVSTHYYTEIDCIDIDLRRLNDAWRRLIERHDMLRAIILPNGQQKVVEKVPPYEISILDLRNQESDIVEARLSEIRARLSHLVLPSNKWPLFEIRASLLDEQRIRLHLSFDALTVDARSRNLLFREWSQLYEDPQFDLPALDLLFRDFVMATASLKETSLYREAEAYWNRRLSFLPPPPELPLARNQSTILQSRFKRLEGSLEAGTWAHIKERASRKGLRPSVLLLAVFSECLKRWCIKPRMTVNLTLFNRMARDDRLAGVVGDFTSSTLLAVDNENEDRFITRALCIQKQLEEDLAHSSVSGVQIIRKLAQHRHIKSMALMPVVFTSLLSLREQTLESAPTDWLGEVCHAITQTPQVSLDHQAQEIKGSLIIVWDIVDGLFPDGMIQDMMQTYIAYLSRLAADDHCWESPWREEARQLIPTSHLHLYNSINGAVTETSKKLLHESFFAHASYRPTHIAIVSRERNLTYEQLADYSLRVGHWLQCRGAKPNHLVAVVMEKGWEQVVAVLGILQSGAAYVPIDPTLPKERLWHLLDQAQSNLVVTQPNIDRTVEWPNGVRRLQVSESELAVLDNTPLTNVQSPEDLAYMIFTSGSEGTPKGVMIEHRGPVNTISDINQRFGVGSSDRVLALSSLSFDLSVYDIFGTLAAGGTIVIPDAYETRNPANWVEIIERENVTVWNSVPALMKLLVEYLKGRHRTLPRSLRLILLSGDWIPLSLPDQIRKMHDTTQVINLGGATEASIWSILYPINKVNPDWKSLPYGRPMTNQCSYILDHALEPCPIWVPGQLYIGGIGIAKGYWRDEERTNASFIIHSRTGKRLYRTGDIGRYLPDGNIEFIGREDHQVKIQGYRIELGEIEAVLEQNPAVYATAVAAVGSERGEKRLACYVVPVQQPGPSSNELRQFLTRILPEYMVPQFYIMLDKLPLTANGKVDRKALLELDFNKPAIQSGRSAENDVPAEKESVVRSSSQGYKGFDIPTVPAEVISKITGIVAKILGIGDLAPHDNLLNLGATSVDMIRIVNQMNSKLHFRPAIDVFYKSPSPLGLAQLYEQLRAGTDKTSQQPRKTATTCELNTTSFLLLSDPEERRQFKQTKPGLRTDNEARPSFQLNPVEPSNIFKEKCCLRRSYRHFLPNTIPINSLSALLNCLRQVKINAQPKYLYASAGGLYPVQTYLYVKPERIDGLPGGIYYHDPVVHRLIQLAAGVEIDQTVYDLLVNRPIFSEAAFSIFLIAQSKAILPMYGERGLHYAAIEAGLITQLLELAALEVGIGLCQIGDLNFSVIKDWFALDEGHVMLHSLLGGKIDEQSPTIEQLADKIRRGEWAEQTSTPIKINPCAQKTPLFWVHDMFLAGHLQADQPLYVVHPLITDEELVSQWTIEKMAADHLNEIRSIQPKGPYILGGFCFWAVIALEMARQLMRQGDDVSFLFLVEPPLRLLPADCLPPDGSLKGRFIHHSRKLASLKSKDKMTYFLQNFPYLFLYIKDRVLEKTKISLCNTYLFFRQPLPATLKAFYTNNCYARHLTLYHPQPYPGRLVIFQAEKIPDGVQLDWSSIASGRMDIYTIPGTEHLTIIQEPCVSVLSGQISKYLKQIQVKEHDQKT
jgi:pyochelin synthetase